MFCQKIVPVTPLIFSAYLCLMPGGVLGSVKKEKHLWIHQYANEYMKPQNHESKSFNPNVENDEKEKIISMLILQVSSVSKRQILEVEKYGNSSI